MNAPMPPVKDAAELEQWRLCARRYRDHMRGGFGHQRALDALVARMVADDERMARTLARATAEAAISWTREHHPDYFAGCE